MAQPFDSNSAGFKETEYDLDTIELELSPEQLLALARVGAVEESTPGAVSAVTPVSASAVTPVSTSAGTAAPASAVTAVPASAAMAVPVPAAGDSSPNVLPVVEGKIAADAGAPRKPLRGTRLLLGLGVLGAMVLFGRFAHLAKSPPPPEPVIPDISPYSVTVQRVALPPTVAVREPVLFRNPFDASEMFEFPPGTSTAEARDAVADLLLERARERSSAQVAGQSKKPEPQSAPAEPASVAQRH